MYSRNVSRSQYTCTHKMALPANTIKHEKISRHKKGSARAPFFRPESYTMAAPLRRKLNKMFRINSNIETNISNHKPNENIFDEQMERPPGIEEQKKTFEENKQN